LDHYPITADFDFKYRYEIEPAWQDKDGEELKFAIAHYINVVSDIHALLTKRKPSSHEVESLSLRASECWENGRFDEAVELGAELVARGEANYEIYLMLAEYAFKIQEYVRAVDLFQKALEDDGDPLQAHVGMIRSFLKAGRRDDAQRHFSGIRAADPELADLMEDILNSESGGDSTTLDGESALLIDPIAGNSVKKVLNVGGNSKKHAIPDCFDGWRHDLLDIDPIGNPDILCDARELGKLPSRQYDAIYCSHNLEHYFLHEVPKVLHGFNLQLKQDGFVYIRVPDVRYIISLVHENNLDLDDRLYDSLAYPITVSDVLWGFGRQMEQTGKEFFAHKAGFSKHLLSKYLSKSGFRNIYIKCDNKNFEIVAIAFKAEPDNNLLTYIESSEGFVRQN